MDLILPQVEQLQVRNIITGFINIHDNDFFLMKKFLSLDCKSETDQTLPIENKNVNAVQQFSQSNELAMNHLRVLTDQELQSFIDNYQMEVDSSSQGQLLHTDTISSRNQYLQQILRSIDKILTKNWDNVFCFCPKVTETQSLNDNLLDNCVEIAVKFVRQIYNIERVSIVNLNIHHCERLEKVFYEDPNTLVASIHRYDSGKFYPGSGDPVKRGGANGLFKTVNVGWNLDTFKVCPKDDDYIYAYNRLVGPITKEFNPQFIFVLAGFDSTIEDPLGDIRIKPEGYQYIIQKLSEICPQIFVLSQQGQNQNQSEECAIAILKQLQGIPKIFSEQITPNLCGISAVTSGVDKHKEFWKSLETKELLDYQRQFLGINCDFISGGHIQSFKINGDEITKITKKREIDFYYKLNDKNDPYYLENQKFLKFVPKFISADYEELSVTLENLIYGLENASILDLKIGYKTYDPNGNPLKREKAIQTAHNCQQITMGFRVAGVKIKDQNGALIYDRNGTKADQEIKNHEQMKDIITKVFKSNSVNQVNQKALEEVIQFVQDLINAVSESKRMFRSTSILILVDNMAQKHRIKWIDFCYVMDLIEDIESPNEIYDKNVVGGLTYLLEMLKSIS